MLAAARPHLLRVLGPNCVGLLVPGIKLNASFAPTGALPGNTAFVSQSGALATAVLDWAKSRGIGFTKFICLGDSADVDCADVLDYLGSDPETRAVLLHIEAITGARKFMSAARAAARNKPVLVVKTGRAPEAPPAAAFQIGAPAGTDEVYDAAIRRAGMLRVASTKDLFAALETLARARPLGGDRLTIMTNGHGPGVMAMDALIGTEGRLASLSQETLRKLDTILPFNRSRDNPVDIMDDAPAERYVQTLQSLLGDPQSDAVLFIHAPTAIVPSAEIAAAVAPVVKASRRNVLACWLGGDAVRQARDAFAQAGIPTYDTPEEGVRTFTQMVQYRRNQNLLMEVPPSRSAEFVHDRDKAHAVVEGALADGRTLLSEPEANAVLAAYGVPVVDTRIAATAGEAVAVARAIGFPVALKIRSSDVVRKSDVGGVVLDLEISAAVEAAAKAMLARVRQYRPDARLEGFTVQTMVRRPNAHELVLGVTTDAVFGPVVIFGQGGTAVGAAADRAVALPPLNAVLARDLISRTHVSKLLAGYGGRPPADIGAVTRTLIQLAQLVADIPEIVEIDIDPLVADERGVLALDARMRVAPLECRRPRSLRDSSLSGGARGVDTLAGAESAVATHQAGGRCAARRILQCARPGGYPLSNLHAHPRAARVSARASHADRLRSRNGVHRRQRARPRSFRDARRSACGCGSRQHRRRIRDHRAIRPQRTGARPDPFQETHRLLPKPRNQGARG